MTQPASRSDEGLSPADKTCAERCPSCRERWPYTQKSVTDKTWFFHAVGEAQLRCHADDIRRLVASIRSERGSIVWPKKKLVGRMGEMAPKGDMNLHVCLQDDGDVIVECWEVRHGRGERASVEFCTVGPGGGRSPKTREALIALMVAIEADNEANPERAFPPQQRSNERSDSSKEKT